MTKNTTCTLGKLFVLALAVCALVVGTAGCTPDPFQQYESFYTDLDLRVRMEDAVRKAEEGDTSAFFVDELRTLLYDIKSFTGNDEMADEINGLMEDSVLDLLRAVAEQGAGETEKAQSLVEQASFSFMEAQTRYQDFMLEHTYVTNKERLV